MKFLELSILIAIFAGQKVIGQESDTVRQILLGNDPNVTLTEPIGQVLQPVGIPVIQPPTSSWRAPDLTTPPPPSSALKKKRYELGEDPKKETKDQKEIKRAATRELLFSNQIFGEGGAASTISQQKTQPERIRVPYSKPPAVQKIPYNR